jgi:hypothetical protein
VHVAESIFDHFLHMYINTVSFHIKHILYNHKPQSLLLEYPKIFKL